MTEANKSIRFNVKEVGVMFFMSVVVVVLSLVIYDAVFVSKRKSRGNIKGITSTDNNIDIESKYVNCKSDFLFLTNNNTNTGGGSVEIGDKGATIRGKDIYLIAENSISFSLQNEDGRKTYAYTKDGMQEFDA